MLENITNNGLIEPVSTTFGSLLSSIYFLVGGIFGIYVIVFIAKLIMNFRIRSYMKDIKNELKDIKKSITQLQNKVSKIDNDLNTKEAKKIKKTNLKNKK